MLQKCMSIPMERTIEAGKGYHESIQPLQPHTVDPTPGAVRCVVTQRSFLI